MEGFSGGVLLFDPIDEHKPRDYLARRVQPFKALRSTLRITGSRRHLPGLRTAISENTYSCT
jgi:hypothetical protein